VSPSTTLDALGLDRPATITQTCGSEAPLLRAMGLREGASVTLRQSGASCIVETCQTRVGLSAELTRSLNVTPID